jgi:nitrate reductase NapE component
MLIVAVISWTLALGLLSRIVSSYLSNYNLKKHETTTSQIIAFLVQLSIALWSVKVVLAYGYYDTTGDILNILYLGMGYYLYDTIYMMVSTTTEADNFILYCHHIGSFVILLNCYFNNDMIHPYLFGASFIPLELSSAGLNLSKLCKVFNQQYTREIEFVNIVAYGLLRLILFPVLTLGLIYQYCTFEQIIERIVYYKYAIPTVLLTVLYVICVHWFKTMVQKYYNKRVTEV